MISLGSVFLELVVGHAPKRPGPGEETRTGDSAVPGGDPARHERGAGA
jgi:hypothetical protein